jgi:hypothetical protein
MAMYIMKSAEKATKIMVGSWAKINNIEDVYTVNGTTKKTFQVYGEFPNKADEDEFKAEIQAAFDEFKASPEAKGKKFDERYPASLGYVEKDGKTLFKFWTYSEYKATDDKPATKKHIPVFVFGKGPLGEKNIGNGSKIQVAYVLSPYWSSAKGFGVSLNMNKVLVRELIEYGGSSDDMSIFGVDVSGADGVFAGTGVPEVDEDSIPF